jgi:hypothetical protein
MAGGLERAGEEHFPQERREWVVQRVAWVVMVLILVAALLGAFGNGVLSKRTANSEDGGLRVEYQKIVRFQAISELRLKIDVKEPGDEGLVTLTIGGGYLEHFELESVVPEPEEQRSGEGHVVLMLRPVRPGEPVEVTVRAKVEKLGEITGELSVQGGGLPQRVRLEQFALP